jgi:hypothetical protein
MHGKPPGQHVLTAISDEPEAERRASTSIPLSKLRNPIVCEAFATWQRLCGGRRFPSRADMSPRAMRGFLKNMTLVQVLDGGQDFRYRVSGDAVNLQQGMNLQGVTLTEIDARIPHYGSHLRKLYQRVLRRREPLAYRGLYYRPADQHTFSHESIMAPLSDDGETIDHLIVVAA